MLPGVSGRDKKVEIMREESRNIDDKKVSRVSIRFLGERKE